VTSVRGRGIAEELFPVPMKRYVVERGIAALFWAAVVGALMFAGASSLEMDQPGIMAILAAMGAAVYVLFFA
jgi:hypothetical protein